MNNLLQYILHLADNALILGHRNSEWTGHGPILEQDIALSNISLDLIGQSRNLYQYAAKISGNDISEDTLAFLRNADEFHNCLLVEQPNGHWGQTIMRQFLFSAYHFPLCQQLLTGSDEQLAAIAEKSLKEVTYHLRWSSEWVIRLGQGTTESAEKMLNAVNTLMRYTEELYTPADYESALIAQNIGADAAYIRNRWRENVNKVFGEAGLPLPQQIQMQFGGKQGKHTPHLKELLQEMQYMQRTYPGVEW